MSQTQPYSSLLSRLLSGAFVVYGVGAALILLSQLLLTRLLGVEQYGVYYYVLSWLTLLVVIAKLGVDHAMLRFLPTYLVNCEWGSIAGMLRWGTRVVGRSSLLLALCCALVVYAFVQAEHGLLATFLLGCVVLPLWAYGFLRQAAMRALRQNVLALMPELIVAPLLIMAMVAGARAAGVLPSAPLAMTATVIAFGAALALGGLWLRGALPPEVRTSSPAQYADKWRASARALFVGGSMHLVMSNTDAAILGMLVGTDVVGVYGIAARTASLVAFPLTIANTAFVPMIAEMLASGRERELEKLLRQGMRLVGVASATIVVGFAFWGDRILALFGSGFEEGVLYLWVLAIGQLINAFCGPVAYVVAYSGREATVAKVLVGAAALNVALNLLLVSRWEATGAAIATTLCLAGWNLVLYVMACRRVGVSAGVFAFYGRAS